jgi:hypothetical protein
MSTPLCILAEKYLSDKTPKINHYYTPEYYQLLKDKKYEKVLEIGIGYPDLMCRFTNDTYKAGASLYMWKEYFETSEIFGCDIRDIQLEGIKTFVCDQSDTLQLENMMDKIGNVDFIIDDGSHILSHQIISFKTLWKYCNDIYIIEDVPPQHLDEIEQLSLLFSNCECIKKYIHPKDNQGFISFQKK